MFSLCTFFPTMTLNLNSDLRPWPMYLTLMWSSWTTLQVSMSKSILMEAYRSAQRDRQTDRQTQLTDCITRLLQRSVQSNAKDLCTIHWWISKANYWQSSYHHHQQQQQQPRCITNNDHTTWLHKNLGHCEYIKVPLCSWSQLLQTLIDVQNSLPERLGSEFVFCNKFVIATLPCELCDMFFIHIGRFLRHPVQMSYDVQCNIQICHMLINDISLSHSRILSGTQRSVQAVSNVYLLKL